MINFFGKIKNLGFKKFNSKNAALFLLNRKIPQLGGGRDNFGKITDLRLDRKARTISFEVSRENQAHTITVKKYRFVEYKGRSCLSWLTLDCRGPQREHYNRILHDIKRIEVPRRYLSLLEVVL